MFGEEDLRYSRALEQLEQEANPGFQVEDIFNYVAATTVDTLVTAADSLTLGLFDDDEIDGNKTSQILHWMNEDLAGYYEKHREGVELGSFIGGMILPGMATAKALKWAKSGSSNLAKRAGTSFKASGEWKAKAVDAMAKEGAGSAKWNNALSKLKTHTLGQGVAEGLLYESSFVLFNNQHSYMDNSYGIGDYVLGAGLGALMGPLRWMMTKKELQTAAIGVRRDQLSTQVYGHAYADLQGGDKLAFDMALYGEMKGSSNAVAIDLKNIREKSMEDQLLSVQKTLEDMSSPEFRELNKETIERTGQGHIGFGTDADPLDILPVDNLTRMLQKNSEAFRGVASDNGLSSFTDSHRLAAYKDAIVRQEGKTFYAESGESARQTLLAKFNTRKHSRDELESLKEGLGIEARSTIDGAEIVLRKNPTAAHKQWIADYIKLSEHKDLPVKITGDTRNLKIHRYNRAVLAEERALGLDDIDKFIPYSKLLDNMEDVGYYAVVDPHAPGHILGEIEARGAMGAAQDARVLNSLNKKATMKDSIKYSREGQSVAASEGKLIEAMYAVDRLPHGKKVDLEADDWFKLQAVITKYGDKIGAKSAKGNPLGPASVSLGNKVFNDVFDAKQALWNWKQTEAKALKDLGASDLQVAKKLNIGIDAVESMQQGKYELPLSDLNVARFTKPNPEHYLQNKAILLKGDALKGNSKLDEIKSTVMMDKHTAQKIHYDNVQRLADTAQIQGGEMRQLASEVLLSDDVKAISANMEKLLVAIDSKPVWINSVDHLIRSTGAVGDSIHAYGRKLQELTNKFVSRTTTNFISELSVVKQDKASATQFAILLNRLEGHSSDQLIRAQLINRGEKESVISLGTSADELGENILKYADSDQDLVLTPEMTNFMRKYLPTMREHKQLSDMMVKMQGGIPKRGIGIWFPYHNMDESFIAFKISKTDNSDVKMISSPTAKGLEEEVTRISQEAGDSYRVITRGKNDIAEWNELHRYAELNNLSPANSQMKKGGTEGSLLPGDVAIENFLKNLRGDAVSKFRRIAKLANSDIFDQLDFMAQRANAAADSGKGFLGQKLQRKVTIPEIVSKAMLNKSLVEATPVLDMINNITKAKLNSGIHYVNEGIATVTGKDGNIDFEQLSGILAERNIPNPWSNIDEFLHSAAQRKGRDVGQHKLATLQSALVTMNLRFLEVSHAIVTMASLPVILATEANHLRKGGQSVNKFMYQAVKFMQGKTPESRRVMDYGAEMKYTKSIVAETSELMADLPGMGSAELNARRKKMVDMFSKPSDWAEGVSREYAYALGYLIAKQKYPEASQKLLTSHAAAFGARTMGNYVSRQKPTMFQGAFGQMVGLYQTFMLTMGQNLYRYAEAGDKRALTGMVASYTGMFGMESLPFFSSFNRMMGEYASDDHEDVRTTVYNVFGNTDDQSRSIAEYMLFGIPSTLFNTGVYTRATLDVRSPIQASGDSGLSFRPALFDAGARLLETSGNMIADSYRAVKSGGGFGDMAGAAMQGFAAQSLWRPGARYTELLMGKSYDQKGEVVDTDTRDEPFSIMARILGSRPLEEQAVRNLRYQASFYNRVDRDKQQRVIKEVRGLVSRGEDPSRLDGLMEEYLKHSSVKGWNTILNTAYASSETNYARRIADYAQKQPAIAEIADSYGN